MKILLNLPRVFTWKAVKARDLLSGAIHQYFLDKGYEQGSALIRMRVRNGMDMGLSLDDSAKLVLLIPTTPTTFWIIFHLFSEPAILQRCRAEVEGIMTTTKRSGRPTLRRLDISRLKTDCPYLLAVFQEVLRQRSAAPAARRVMRDCSIGDYMLKKDANLYIPTRVFHMDPAIWGPDAATFRPERWLRGTKGYRAISPFAMRPFGGGQTLCPGRHFAMTEVLTTAVAMVLRYDLHPVEGAWKAPSTDKTSVAAVVMEPDCDIEVEVRERAGFQGDEWLVELKDTDEVFAISAEDKASAIGTGAYDMTA